MIEHNLATIKVADHILDLRPEEVAEVAGSYTGQYLKPMLERQKEAAE